MPEQPSSSLGFRQKAILATIAIQVAYFALRFLTLNVDSAGTLAYSLVVLAAEAFLGVSFTLVLFELWRPTAAETREQSSAATVDVIVVVRDEELTLFRATLAACARLELPHRTVVLDCVGRLDVRDAAEEIGADYCHPAGACATRGMALDSLLPRLAGEVIAVFDVGAIPEADFLVRTTPYFSDPMLAGLQTSLVAPAALFDDDPTAADLSARSGSRFHRERQIGRNHWNAAILDDSAFVARREAVDSARGFGAEDGEARRLSIRFHRAGLRTVFLDAPLCIDFRSIDAVFAARSNAAAAALDWGASARENAVFGGGLSLAQRLCYASSMLAAASCFARAVLYLTPLAMFASAVLPFAPSLAVELSLAALAYHVGMGYVRVALTDGKTTFRGYELNALATAWTTCASLAANFASHHSTRANRHRSDSYRWSAASAVPHGVFVALTAASVFWAWMGPAFGLTRVGVLILPTAAAVWNAALSLVVVERFLARWDRRKSERRSALIAVQYDVPGEKAVGGGLGMTFDLSENGLGLIAFHPFITGQTIFMTLEGPDGRMRLQGEVRSVRRVGSGMAPGLDRPSVYRVGVLLTRMTSNQRDLLVYWGALQAARDVKRSLYDESLRQLLGRSSLTRNARRRLHVPVLLDGETEDKVASGCVTHEVGPAGFRVLSPRPLEGGRERRFAMATPFGSASGWVKLERELVLGDSTTMVAQEFTINILDPGSDAVLRRMNSSRRGDATVKDALSPYSGDANPSLKTYAIAASVWFLLAAPLLSMSFMHNHAHEILLGRLVATHSLPTRAEVDELEAFSRTLIASNAASTLRLEQLYRILSRSSSGRETTRLAEALARRNPTSIEWHLRWGEGLAAAGLYKDAEKPLTRAMELAESGSAEGWIAAKAALEQLENAQQHAASRPAVQNASLVRSAAPRPAWSAAKLASEAAERSNRIISTIAKSIPRVDVDSVALAASSVSGEWKLTSGRPEDARRAFRQALRMVEQDSKNEPLSKLLFARYFETCLASPSSAELSKEAREVVALIHRNPKVDAQTLVRAALYFSKSGDNIEAIALLDRAHRQAPRDARIAQRLAVELEAVGDYARAAEVLKSLLTDLAPKN